MHRSLGNTAGKSGDGSAPEAELLGNADYMSDNPPDSVKTDSLFWRTTIDLQRQGAAALKSANERLGALQREHRDKLNEWIEVSHDRSIRMEALERRLGEVESDLRMARAALEAVEDGLRRTERDEQNRFWCTGCGALIPRRAPTTHQPGCVWLKVEAALHPAASAIAIECGAASCADCGRLENEHPITEGDTLCKHFAW